ncbi:MAG: signal peptidase I [Ignavibacteriae bacterium]|nr:MAG: signal peptidase I [Ignavibacteriota bacterium]
MNNDKKPNKEDQPAGPITFKEKTIAFLKETGIVLGLFLLINNFVVASFLVPTGSMENEVLTGELLFVNKFIYGGTSPRNIPFTNVRLPWFRVPAIKDVKRGDVIVFVFPGMRDEVEPQDFTFYLKRCVGVSGDTIQIRNRVLSVNGQMLPLPRNVRFDRGWSVSAEEPDDRIFPAGSGWNEDNYGPIVVPKKGMVIPLSIQNIPAWQIFIKREGHRVESASGTVLIDGTPATSYTVQRDYLFGMGDHRDNSLDGRYWGFIPKENIVGTPMIVYWSWNTDLPLYDIFGRLASVRWGRIGSLIK